MLPPEPPTPQPQTSPKNAKLTANISTFIRRRFLNPITQTAIATETGGNRGIPLRPNDDVVGEVVTVNVVDPGVMPPNSTLAGENVQVAPAGRPEQMKVTAELNPLAGVTVTVVVALCPAVTVSDVGEAATVKLGGGRLTV